MKTVRFLLMMIALAYAGVSAGTARAENMFLLHVSAGDLPTDTATGATNFSTEDYTALSGKRALKVDLVDSFGDSRAKITDWRPFKTLRFEAFNPGSTNIRLELNIKHSRSTDLRTRVVLPFTLKPGKNEIQFELSEMRNSNKSTPDLAHVKRWYIATGSGRVTVYFGDIWLDGGATTQNGDTPPPPTSPPNGASPPANNSAQTPVSYEIKGKVGTMDVDLILTPRATAEAKPLSTTPFAEEKKKSTEIQPD